jgi:hypothetical protein
MWSRSATVLFATVAVVLAAAGVEAQVVPAKKYNPACASTKLLAANWADHATKSTETSNIIEMPLGVFVDFWNK